MYVCNLLNIKNKQNGKLDLAVLKIHLKKKEERTLSNGNTILACMCSKTRVLQSANCKLLYAVKNENSVWYISDKVRIFALLMCEKRGKAEREAKKDIQKYCRR